MTIFWNFTSLREDLSAQHNSADLHPAAAARLKHRLVHWQQKIEAEMPVLNPAHGLQLAEQLGKPGK